MKVFITTLSLSASMAFAASNYAPLAEMTDAHLRQIATNSEFVRSIVTSDSSSSWKMAVKRFHVNNFSSPDQTVLIQQIAKDLGCQTYQIHQVENSAAIEIENTVESVFALDFDDFAEAKTKKIKSLAKQTSKLLANTSGEEVMIFQGEANNSSSYSVNYMVLLDVARAEILFVLSRPAD